MNGFRSRQARELIRGAVRRGETRVISSLVAQEMPLAARTGRTLNVSLVVLRRGRPSYNEKEAPCGCHGEYLSRSRRAAGLVFRRVCV